MHLWIFLSTDNVLTLLQYDTGGYQSVELPGLVADIYEKYIYILHTVSCHGSVLQYDTGGYIISVPW